MPCPAARAWGSRREFPTMDPAKTNQVLHDRRLMVAVERAETESGEALPERTRAAIDEINSYTARNYNPLPVVVSEADGVWVTDVEGKRYLDMLSAYSALNFGHGIRGWLPLRVS